ncbi:hypothetical protein GE09DRAFT_1219212 [Coniochaeta sp. 2T2.1]|nr:hypothetical protein GE09DRAFT_1219212 [Coniochaeta sp. 2T2.1]
MSARTILVTGATGKQGSGVIRALLDSPNPYTILAVTRNASSPASQKLLSLSPNIHLVQGDLDDIPTLWATAVSVARSVTSASASPNNVNANDGPPIWGVYSVQVSMGSGVTEASEIRQGTGLNDAAVSHNVKIFVYSSVERGGDDASWDNETPIAHFRSKHRIEHHLRTITSQPGQQQQQTGGQGSSSSMMMWTVLRPVAFMDNLTPGFETSVFLAALHNKIPRAKKVQWVASGDIGRYAAMAFDNPEEWNGRAVGLAGDELTLGELGDVFGEVTGKPAPVTYWFLGSVLTTLVREMGLMIGWFGSDGYKADVAGRRREYPGLMDLEAYLRDSKEWQAVTVR